jgi:hypothetical protein
MPLIAIRAQREKVLIFCKDVPAVGSIWFTTQNRSEPMRGFAKAVMRIQGSGSLSTVKRRLFNFDKINAVKS